MRFIPFLLLLASCFSQHGQSIDDVIEESIKKKEGVDIRIDPIKEAKALA